MFGQSHPDECSTRVTDTMYCIYGEIITQDMEVFKKKVE